VGSGNEGERKEKDESLSPLGESKKIGVENVVRKPPTNASLSLPPFHFYTSTTTSLFACSYPEGRIRIYPPYSSSSINQSEGIEHSSFEKLARITSSGGSVA